MASMFQSLLERTKKLLGGFPLASSSSSSTSSQIGEELGKLRRRTVRIQAVLKDAEEREIREESVRLWLAELRDVAYDSEDVLDEVEYELQRYQLESEEEEKNTPSSHEERGIKMKREVSDFHVTLTRCPPLQDASFQQQIVAKIKKINNLFNEIYRDGRTLKLHKESGQRHGASFLEPSPKMPTSCFVDEQGVHGRDDDKRKVIDMLLSNDDDSHCKQNVRAVSIVGMGGLGKTTLAQLVYNDDQVVKKHFKIRSWVCVSDSFDVVRLTKEIVQALGGGSSGVVQESSNFSSLQENLRKALQGKRFLLVLDDVWNESQEHWEALWVSLLVGAEGSRVLLTTRSETVSKNSRVNPANMHRLGCLSAGDSWSLFEQRAFGRRSDYPELMEIGQQIVRRCKGLPLMLKTLGGLLFCEFRKERWLDILKSELWELREGKDGILPALKLSYHHLPSPLKPCFAFCAVFPKDHEFEMDDLVKMWMAHGYIKPPSAKKCVEDVGRGYFEDLLQRSLFQRTRYRHDKFIMHDLIHDLASSIWSGECCEVVDGRLSSDRVRHLVFNCWQDVERLLSHESSDNLKRLRTCYFTYSPEKDKFDCALDHMFGRMKYLRVLNLGNVFIKELPNSVGHLKHLRYLRTRASYFQPRLPESLGNLLNLQTLDLIGSSYNECRPTMPRGIGRLTQLRTLPVFVVGEGSGAAGIEELTHLDDLQGKLKIVVKSLDNWVKRSGGGGGRHDNYGKEACSILKNKQGLTSLIVEFQVFSCSATMQQEELLESLQPHTNVKELRISNYGGVRFPKWMGDVSSSGLERIRLWYGNGLPAVGQLSWVKYLQVELAPAATSVVCEFLNGVSFPSLEELCLTRLRECEGLTVGTEEGGAFPRLHRLEIDHCDKLEYVKLRHLTALRKLHIHDCEELTELDYYYHYEHDGDDDDYDVSISQSITSSSPLAIYQQQVLINDHMHIPGVHTMRLKKCPKLNFPPAQKQQQQQLPPSLRIFDVTWSPLVSEWVARNRDKLVGINYIFMVDGSGQPVLSLRNMRHVELEGYAKHFRFRNPAEAEQVLRKVFPLFPFGELVIQGYRGRSFLDWVGHPGRLCCLEKMTVSGWINCDRLPPLGRLPFLKKLHISRMPKVTRVDREFFGGGDGGSSAFQSLRTLEFHDMPQWEEWQEVEDGAFPNLHVLRIYNCPNLRTLKLAAFPPLLKLESDSTLELESNTAIDLELRLWPPLL